MRLNEYQAQARTTALYPGQGTLFGLTYTLLKLNGEAGECAEKLGKLYRDAAARPGDWTGSTDFTFFRETMVKELGDVLWYIAAAAEELGVPLEAVAVENLNKLISRAARGKLGGEGDDR